MDIEVLIAAVFKRTPIWDKRHKLHSNRNSVDRYWKEISNEIIEDEAKVRKKWKYLRDQFSVELGKLPVRRSGDAAEDDLQSKWPYFSQLLFLKDIVKPRASSGNLSSGRKSTQQTYEYDASQASTGGDRLDEDEDDNQTTQDSNQDEIVSENIEEGGTENNEENGTENVKKDSVHNNLTSPASTSTVTPVTKRRRTLNDTFNASVLEIEKRKLEYLEAKSKRNKDQEDEHLLFFKSLLPHVRKIPQSRILSFRCRVQELVNQSAYNETAICTQPSTSSSPFSCSNSSGYGVPNQNIPPSDDNTTAYNFSLTDYTDL
ncbi:unnamed protein product [Phaedon cochleariae]|uniref:MADF domain-containing protein n=1 Tax=Phaedon cochleariae TaxID=80249 RepID=A0A9N9X467_PHACE|nr:unnamed protein product [Phaedon cochleariae]